jgi:hypothetical protein
MSRQRSTAPEPEELPAHIRVARSHRGLAWINGGLGLVSVALIAALGGTGLWPAMLMAGLFFGGIALAHTVVARGAYAARPYAQTASLVIAVMLLPAFPLGTAAGLYLIVHSLSPWLPPARRDAPAAGKPQEPGGPL